MLIQVYWNKRTIEVIVPTTAKTEAGYWLGIEPVETASLNDSSLTVAVIKRAAERGGQIIPTPTRQNFPKPVVLPYSNTKGWREFERNYEPASIVLSSGGNYSIERYRRNPDGAGYIVDSDLSVACPEGASLEEAAMMLINSVRA